eukprot:938349_1
MDPTTKIVYYESKVEATEAVPLSSNLLPVDNRPKLKTDIGSSAVSTSMANVGALENIQLTDLMISIGNPIDANGPDNECHLCTCTDPTKFFAPFFNELGADVQKDALEKHNEFAKKTLQTALTVSSHPKLAVKEGIVGGNLLGTETFTVDGIKAALRVQCGAGVCITKQLSTHRFAPAHLRVNDGRPPAQRPVVMPVKHQFREKLSKIFHAYWDSVMLPSGFPQDEFYRKDHFFRCHIVHNADLQDCLLVFHGAGTMPDFDKDEKGNSKYQNFSRIKSGIYSVKKDSMRVFSLLSDKSEFKSLLATHPD